MKLRVLEVLATLKRAGAERVAVSLATWLDPERFETGVVSLFDAFAGGLETELEAAGVRVWHLGKKPGLDVRMIPRLRGVCREFRPDVMHTHSYVLRYGMFAPARIRVHTVHNIALHETDFAGRLLHRAVFGRRVAAVAVGQEVRRSYRLWYGAEPAATIRNGIDLEAQGGEGARSEWRAAHGFGADDFLVVAVGRLDEQKNPLLLVEAFTRAFGGDAHAHLVLAGDGALRDAIRGERVHRLGVLPDVGALLAAADMFALASDWEGTPLAVMEAQAAGLPVAATAVGGVPELVKNGVTGVLAPPRDPIALSEALARVRERRTEMAEAAREHARQFDARTMVDRYAALFERLAGGAR